MITSHQWFMRVFVGSRVRRNGRASIRCVVRWAIISGTGRQRTIGSASNRNCTSHFRVSKPPVLPAALPEFNTTTSRVIVCGARAKSLLLLVMATQGQLNNSGDEEEETRDI